MSKLLIVMSRLCDMTIRLKISLNFINKSLATLIALHCRKGSSLGLYHQGVKPSVEMLKGREAWPDLKKRLERLVLHSCQHSPANLCWG